MNKIYSLLVLIHIFSAILSVGPLFLMNRILRSAKSVNELKYAHQTVNKISGVAHVSLLILLPTGLLMGLINSSLFKMIWYDASLALFIVYGVYSHLVLDRKSKALYQNMMTYTDQQIPQQYTAKFKELVSYEWIGKMITVVIVFLMVLKP